MRLRVGPALVFCALVGQGARLAPASAGTEVLAGIAVQKDGRVLLAGSTNAGGTKDVAVARLGEGGTLDPAFAGGGLFIDDLGGGDQAAAVGVGKRGRMVAAGYTKDGPGT